MQSGLLQAPYKKQISFTVIFKFQLVVFAIRKQISLNSLPMPLHSGPPGDIITSVLFCGSCFHSCSIIHNLNLCSAYASGSFPSFYAGARLALRLPLSIKEEVLYVLRKRKTISKHSRGTKANHHRFSKNTKIEFSLLQGISRHFFFDNPVQHIYMSNRQDYLYNL